MKLCPNCKSELERANGMEGYKPSADWFCQKCWQESIQEYLFYDSEVLIFK